MKSTAAYIPTMDLVEDGARSDDLEFRAITKLLNVLQDRSLFGGLRAKVSAVDYYSPVTGSDARRQLKILRQIPFVLVRNHEIVAALSRVLPGGIVGVLSATVAEGDDQNDGLVHLSRNCRHDNDATAFSVLMVPSDMDVPDKILSYVFENWNTSFESHCELASALIRSLFNSKQNEADINTAAVKLLKYVHAECGQKLRRRFMRARVDTDKDTPHYLEILRNLREQRFGRIEFGNIVHRWFPNDHLAGWKEMARMTQREERWFTAGSDKPLWGGKPIWDFGPPEDRGKVKSAIEYMKGFINRINSVDLTLDEQLPELIPEVYYHFLVYATCTISQLEYHLNAIVKIRFRLKKRTALAPLREDFEPFKLHCNILTTLSARAAGLAWHSPMWNRLLAFADSELYYIQEQVNINNVRNAAAKRRPTSASSTAEVETSQQADGQSTVAMDDQDSPENEDATEYTLFMEQLNHRGPAQNQSYPDSLKAEGHSLARRILLWWRLVTFHIESINGWRDMITTTSARRIPQLTFSIIRTPKPDYCEGNPWRELVRTLTKDEDAVQAIETQLTARGKHKLDSSFSGHYHCEAIMCSLLFAARTLDRNAVDSAGNGIEDVLQILSGAKPVIGVSKRCCHICRTIMLFLEQRREKKRAPPSRIRRWIVTPYRRMLPWRISWSMMICLSTRSRFDQLSVLPCIIFFTLYKMKDNGAW
ncbi:hypothetical protein BDD12DRAFT_137421 [Trichophaea hybrida]|nr:hypothetical protein BDD12DRAFT_137421 [Trichophaea hybrida]